VGDSRNFLRGCRKILPSKRYTLSGGQFINATEVIARGEILVLAHTMPHMPLFRSKEFEGRSARGLYGDVIEELDANVGRVSDALRQLKLDRNTLEQSPLAEQVLTAPQLAARRKLQRVLDKLRPEGQ